MQSSGGGGILSGIMGSVVTGKKEVCLAFHVRKEPFLFGSKAAATLTMTCNELVPVMAVFLCSADQLLTLHVCQVRPWAPAAPSHTALWTH